MTRYQITLFTDPRRIHYPAPISIHAPVFLPCTRSMSTADDCHIEKHKKLASYTVIRKSATWLLSQLRRILIDFNMYITARGAGKYTNSTFCTSVLGIRSRLLADACSQCESNNRRRDMYSSLPLRFSETNKQTTCSENDFVCEKQP